jgi:hypothetical protein
MPAKPAETAPAPPPSAPKVAGPALSLPVLELQFGKDWHKVSGEAGGDAGNNLYIWSDVEPLVTAVEQQTVISWFTATPRDAGATISVEKLLGKFADGHEWRDKGSIETPLGKRDVRVRTDGALVALFSEREMTLMLPEEMTRRYPKFTSQFLSPNNRNKIDLRFVR